jgi:hypothetical protein
MDSQSPLVLKYDTSRIDTLRFASYILPPAEYVTKLLNFPITNCHEPYGLKGDFFLSLHLYQGGEKFSRLDLPMCNEQGFFEFDFEGIFKLLTPSKPAIMIAHYSHDKDIPVELYLSNIHRKSGTYLAYPTLSFMGDVLYPSFHATQLENTLFWPGLPPSDQVDAELIIVNPYNLKLEYQVSLYVGEKKFAQSVVLAEAPYSASTIKLSELFTQEYPEAIASGGDSSVCIGAQYKLVAFMSMRHRETNIITTIDHLHTYQLV